MRYRQFSKSPLLLPPPPPTNFKSQFFEGALIKGGGYVVSQSVFPKH